MPVIDPMRLAAFIASHIEDILHEWETAAKAVAPPHVMTRDALRDHWADILQAIADEMATVPGPSGSDATAEPGAALRAAASEHGARRQMEKFEIDELVAEFRAMRATVLQAWLRSADGAATPSVADTVGFCEALDRALAESIDRHLKDRARVRDLFLAMLGHDLRAPLSGIQMAAHILDRPALEETARLRAGGRIRRSLQEMAHLITDLIDFTRSRLGAGLPISKARCDLGALANDALDAVRASFAERRFEGELSGDLSIDADPARMRQLLSNLLYNAVQHGDPDSSISLRAVGHADSVVVEVHNMGAAIPPESFSGLFEPMVQAAKAAAAHGARSNTSMGLGLYIVREIARGHGGTIEVASSTDAGTTFTLRLPRGT